MNLYYPVKDPINQSNLFGANPAYYQKTLGTNGHGGIDFECPMYTPIYAPCDGAAFYAYDRLGGDGLYIRIPDNAHPTANVILWHMPPREDKTHWILPTADGVVTPITAGQLIGYTGNSGFPNESSGPHLHFAVQLMDGPNILNYNNNFHGCIDPLPLFNGQYAEDISKIDATLEASDKIVQQIIQSPISNQDKSSLLDSVKKLLIKLAAFLGFPE